MADPENMVREKRLCSQISKLILTYFQAVYNMRGSGNEVGYKLIFSLTNNCASLCSDFATILEMMKMQICMILGRNMKV